MSRPDFDRQMRRLAGLKFAPATMETHYAVLGNLALDELSGAVDAAQRECSEFLSPAWLLSCVERTRARVQPLPEDRSEPASAKHIHLPSGAIRISRVWHYYDEACSDSGWRSMWCGEPARTKAPWMDEEHCGRDSEHLPHEWVKKCGCWDSNPALVRKRANQAQQAASRTSKRDGE